MCPISAVDGFLQNYNFSECGSQVFGWHRKWCAFGCRMWIRSLKLVPAAPQLRSEVPLASSQPSLGWNDHFSTLFHDLTFSYSFPTTLQKDWLKCLQGRMELINRAPYILLMPTSNMQWEFCRTYYLWYGSYSIRSIYSWKRSLLYTLVRLRMAENANEYIGANKFTHYPRKMRDSRKEAAVIGKWVSFFCRRLEACLASFIFFRWLDIEVSSTLYTVIACLFIKFFFISTCMSVLGPHLCGRLSLTAVDIMDDYFQRVFIYILPEIVSLLVKYIGDDILPNCCSPMFL